MSSAAVAEAPPSPPKPLPRTWTEAGPYFLPDTIALFPGAQMLAYDWTKPNKGRPRMFENGWLEKLTVVHPTVPLAIFIPASAWFLVQGLHAGLSPASAAGLFGAGLLFWTFFEYVAHRFTFHFVPKTKWQALVAYTIHGVHHAFPDDDRRLVMPPVVSVTLSAGVSLFFRAVLGPQVFGPALAGFMIGYLFYDMTHFAVHFFPMKGPVGKFLRKHHMLHHYATPEQRFGVSSPLWDVVFGTLPHDGR